jgi:ammonium transporter, Amt family
MRLGQRIRKTVTVIVAGKGEPGMRIVRSAWTFAAVATTTVAHAQPIVVADSGDSAWVLTASALVLLMALPGLGLFYGGLVRARNVLSVLMHSFVIVCIVSLVWAIAGYSLVFGEGTDWLGGTGNLGLAGLAEIRDGTTISEPLFALFQMTFAAITPALILGAFVERVRFGWVVGFTALWSLLVYVPIARWMWGGGWLAAQGALDFAGGIVVHTTAGVAALVVAILLGKRKSFAKPVPPHSPALVMVGAGMLWVGWFGFNGGSSLAAGADAANAILNTHLAASAAALVWTFIERIKIGKPTSVGLVTGAIAGLATITPAAGYIGPMGAILLGSVGSLAAFAAIVLVKQSFKVDDSLDVFAVHGIGGMVGSLIFPLFVLPFFGGPGFDDGVTLGGQFAAQGIAIGTTILWTGGVTTIVALMVAMVIPMRVGDEEEYDGLDISSHGERGWDFD